jgi:uncharacterized membrane protein
MSSERQAHIDRRRQDQDLQISIDNQKKIQQLINQICLLEDVIEDLAKENEDDKA